MQQVTPSGEVREQFYTTVPVQLSLNGRYHELAKFFYNVSRLQRAINMESISIGNPVLRGEDLILNVGVRATAFRRKDV